MVQDCYFLNHSCLKVWVHVRFRHCSSFDLNCYLWSYTVWLIWKWSNLLKLAGMYFTQNNSWHFVRIRQNSRTNRYPRFKFVRLANALNLIVIGQRAMSNLHEVQLTFIGEIRFIFDHIITGVYKKVSYQDLSTWCIDSFIEAYRLNCSYKTAVRLHYRTPTQTTTPNTPHPPTATRHLSVCHQLTPKLYPLS